MLLKNSARLLESCICWRLFSNDVEGCSLKRDSGKCPFLLILLNILERLYSSTSAASDIFGYPYVELSSARSTLKKCTVFSSILVFIHFKLILESCTTSGVYLQLYQISTMKLLAVVFSKKRSIIDIWQGSKYELGASFFNIFHFLCLDTWVNIWTFSFSSESLQLICSCDVNQKYYTIFYWFPNHLLYIDHGNTIFLYVYTIEMRKSSLWKTSRWNARLIYTINKTNNKSYNKNQTRITKAFEKFLLSERILSIITKIFLFYTLDDIASFNVFKFCWF